MSDNIKKVFSLDGKAYSDDHEYILGELHWNPEINKIYVAEKIIIKHNDLIPEVDLVKKYIDYICENYGEFAQKTIDKLDSNKNYINEELSKVISKNVDELVFLDIKNIEEFSKDRFLDEYDSICSRNYR